MRRGKFGTEPWKKSDEIVEDQDVPVAILAAPDSDGGAGDALGDLRSEWGVDEFQHECLDSGLREGLCISREAFGLGVAFAFDPIATFLHDPLGEHSEMANDGNSLSNDRLDHGEDFPAALDFYKVCTGLTKEEGIFHREFRRGTTPGGQVGGDKGFFRSAGYGAGVVEHVGHGHLRGVGLAEDDHAERVADK